MMRIPSIASMLSLGWQQALRDEASASRQWRLDMAEKERAAIAAGELLARDAIWQQEL
jgi:hypothetical protein